MSQNQNPDRRQSIEPLLPTPATESNDDYDLPVRLLAPLANMGLSYSTAKYIAPISFLYVGFKVIRKNTFLATVVVIDDIVSRLLSFLCRPLIYRVDFAAQNYGMMAKPNMFAI